MMSFARKQASESTNPLTGAFTIHSLKPIDLSNFKKDEVKEYFNNSFDTYESLFTSLKYDKVYYLCPDRLRLPLIFYYGHTAVVYINKLVLANLIKPSERINLEFETTFETGVDEMSWDDLEHYRMGGDYKWPTVEETKEFRLKTRKLINDVIDRTPLELPVTMDSPWWALFMGFEHERIHFETSTVLIRQYPIDMVTRPIEWNYGPSKLNKSVQTVVNPMIKVKETDVRLGKPENFPSYGWDNEYGQVDCRVSAFEASKFKVTNEQFLEFVLSNGYETRDYWSDEGWEWVQFKNAKHPLFWICPNECKSGCGGKLATYSHCQRKNFTTDELSFFFESKNDQQQNHTLNAIQRGLDENGNERKDNFGYKLRVMFDIIAMPYNWPVEVNYHEAKAFCKWKGEDYRLLTEAEHHAIRDNQVTDMNTSSDIIYQKNSKVNHNLGFGSSTPVDFYPANSKGFNDVFGNVWEWCEDHFNGLPGSKTHFLYDDFSSPCYDGRHNIIMGGSWVSTGDEASYFARFMFRRHFFQHCGFRLARSLPTSDNSKPNPQVRLVADHVFVLGGSFPENKVDLDESKLVVNYYSTTNTQYLYDSDLHQDYFDNEVLYEYGQEESKWFEPFMNELNKQLNELNVITNIATHLGASSGRVSFELTKRFNEVVGVDFSARLLDVCFNLQSKGQLDLKLVTKNNQILKLDVRDNLNTSRAIFKQMTWVPNEIPKSDLVLFTMIDRVMNHLSWMKRFREIVKPNGILVIYSKEHKFSRDYISSVLCNEFELINETSTNGKDLFTVWKLK